LGEDGKKGKINVQRFKGLGEMNPLQLRETTMHPETRRLVRLTLPKNDGSSEVMDMLLSKKRVKDRKRWLEEEGDRAENELL
jgi:topoisomerase-4 subunit B